MDGGLRELGDIEVETAREALDEAAAARGARLVEHDVVDHAVLDAQAFHVLAADVENELHARQHLLSAAQVRHRLDLARVDAQRLKQQTLAVAGHRGVADAHERVALVVGGQGTVELGHGGLRAAEHVALVRGVGRPEQRAVLADERRLERGGAGVDTEERYTAVVREGCATHALGVVTLLELSVLVLVREERGETHHLGALHVAEALQTREHVGQLLGARAVGRARERAAARHEQVRVLRHDDGVVGQIERLVEALAQLGQVLERAAKERHVAADGAAAREARDGLGDHRLEDGGGDVLLARALVEQRLHVGLREHAAAACDRIDGGVALRELVEAARVGVEQRRHLVDEGARAAGAGAVHALLDAVVEVDDLRVLAAELDGHVSARDERLDRRLAGDDLLHEADIEPLGEQKAARARDGDRHALVRELLGRLAQHLDHRGAHVGVVALVDRPLDLVRVVEHGEFHRGGAHVDADVQRGFGRGGRR